MVFVLLNLLSPNRVGTQFVAVPSLDLSIPFNCFKLIVFKVWIDHKTRTFSQLFHSHKMNLLAILGLFTDHWQISVPFQILQLMKSLTPVKAFLYKPL